MVLVPHRRNRPAWDRAVSTQKADEDFERGSTVAEDVVDGVGVVDVIAASPEVQVRKGNLLRLTRDRTVICRCAGCDFQAANTGGAASHSRSTRHRVDVSYYVSFSFVPAERLTARGEPS